MEQLTMKLLTDPVIEIIRPAPEKREARSTAMCLCCHKKFPASRMDVDGCGICEECLAP